MVAAGLVFATGLAGCSIGGAKKAGGETASEPAVARIAQLTDSNQLQLPLEEFMPTEQDRAQIQAAYRLRLRQCVEQFGLDYSPAVGSSSALTTGRNARRYGVTDQSQVSVYGYHVPPEVGGGKPVQQQLSAQVETVLSGRGTSTVNGRTVPAGGCVATAKADLKTDQPGADDTLADRLSLESFSRSRADSRVRAAMSHWSACMKQQGFNYATPENAIGDPQFASGDVASRTEISTALADVACKRTTNLVGIWATVESAYQTRSVGQNQEALNALRKNQAEQVKNAARLSSLPQ